MTDFLMDPARVIHSPFRVSTATQRSRSQVRRVRWDASHSLGWPLGRDRLLPHLLAPCAPSLIGLRGRRGNVLEEEGIDVLGGMPLLDIKAYVPEFDVRTSAKTGWYATRSRE